CVAASARRWLRALEPVCTAFASSSAPTSSSGARWSAYRLPLTVTRPAVGRSSPRIIRIVVDFPAPFGPRKPVTRPGRTVNDTESTASFSPYLLVRSTASIIGFLSVLCAAGSCGRLHGRCPGAGRPLAARRILAPSRLRRRYEDVILAVVRPPRRPGWPPLAGPRPPGRRAAVEDGRAGLGDDGNTDGSPFVPLGAGQG